MKISYRFVSMLAAGGITLFAANVCAGDLIISEFMAINGNTLLDEDGDASDWIELHNDGATPVDLGGWHLTDNEGDPGTWAFPSETIPAGGYLVVFASKKDRATAGSELHTNFKLDGDGEYLALVRSDGTTVEHAYAPAYPPQYADVSYGIGEVSTNFILVPESAPCRVLVPSDASEGTDWTLLTGIDDSLWTTGLTGVGFGFPGLSATDIGSMMAGSNDSAYVRIPFVVSGVTNFSHLTLNMAYDDGFAAYLNGELAAAANIPTNLVWSAMAATNLDSSGGAASGSFVMPEADDLVHAGTNMLALHGLNYDAAEATQDFILLPELVGHASSQGERFFLDPTPGTTNSVQGATYIEPVSFGVEPGFYDTPFELDLSVQPASAEIRYTLDGSVPDLADGMLYTNPISITTGSVVRALAFSGGYQSPRVATATYFINETYTLPVVVMSSDPDNFWGPSGLYVVPRDTATEKPAHIAMYETNGELAFSVDAGVDVHGGYTQTFPQKSLAVHMRGPQYGYGSLKYRLFAEKNIESFNKFILRNAGTDWGTAMFRDALMQTLGVEFMNTDYQAYRPVVLLVNGEFRGIHNIREKLTKSYPEENYGVDRDSVDLFKYFREYVVDAGTLTHYTAMRDFIASNDMSVATNYAYVGTQMDVDNFLDYQITEIFSGNYDWPQNNLKAWREQKEGARWRWIFFDLDAAFSLFTATHHNPIDQDSIKRCTTTEDGPFIFRDEESTLVIRRLLDNTDFRNEFIQRFAGHMNVTFATDRVDGMIDLFKSRIEAEMPKQCAKFGGTYIYLPYMSRMAVRSVAEWENHLRLLHTFAQDRPGYVREDIVERFGLPGISQLTVNMSDTNAGQIVVASVPLLDIPFTGLYFDAVPINIQAIPAPGYTFAGWQGDFETTDALTSITIVTNSTVTAVFTQLPLAEQQQIVVSEMMVNPAAPPPASLHDDDDFEFVELSNASALPIDVTGWQFTEGISFTFPEMSIATGEHVVVVGNLEAFASRYDTNGLTIAGAYTGNLADGGERITLEGSRWGPVMLSFEFNDARGWPVAADGAGHSLVPLVSAMALETEGSLEYGGNWRASTYMHGSPGQSDPDPVVDVVINEFMAHTDTQLAPPFDSDDCIELYNTTVSGVVLTNWYLSDDKTDLKKWGIPGGRVVSAANWITFTENLDFHVDRISGFGLDKAGELIYLSHLPGDATDRVADCVRFKGQANGTSWGRYPDGASGWQTLAPTTNAANVPPGMHVLIDEIMYHPEPTIANPENNTNDEYVELYNPLGVPVDLWNVVDGWRLDGEAGFVFPAGTVLQPGGRLVVVGFNPETDTVALNAFMAVYGLAPGQIQILGPFSGKLSNVSGRLALEEPLAADPPSTDIPRVIIDEVIYASVSPWTTQADGTGHSLQRVGDAHGNAPTSWQAGFQSTPGVAPSPIRITEPKSGTTVPIPADVQFIAEVDATAVSGSVQQVEFFLDLTNSLSVATAKPYQYTISHGTITQPGNYTLTAEMTDLAGVHTSPAAIINCVTNKPKVDASLLQNYTLSVQDAALLLAELDLGGLPPEIVWTEWFIQSGPGVVTFENPFSPSTTAEFSAGGVYVLDLVTGYGSLLLTNTVVITVVATNMPNTIRYEESFEDHAEGVKMIGMQGWYGDDRNDAIVMTNDYSATYSGNLPLPLENHELVLSVNGVVTNEFAETASHTNIWLDMMLEMPRWYEAEPPTRATADQFSAYVNADGYLTIWNCPDPSGNPGSNTWTVLPDTSIGTNQFTRITIRADYARDANGYSWFELYINETQVTNPDVLFASASTNDNFLNRLILEGEFSLDDLVVDGDTPFDLSVITGASGPHGQISPSGKVYVEIGSNQTFNITADNYFHNFEVNVDGTNMGPIPSYTFSNVISPHSIAAAFAEDLAAGDTPHWWLAEMNPAWTNDFDAAETNDHDGDSMLTWEEYVAGTHPTNLASVFKVLGIGLESGLTIYWASEPGRVYAVYHATNMNNGFAPQPMVSGLAPHASGTNQWTEGSVTNPAFYRIGVSITE